MKKWISLLLVVCIAFALCGCSSSDYKKAVSLYNEGEYDQAKALFVELGEYKDSALYVDKCDYGKAVSLYNEGEYDQAKALFVELGEYEDSALYADKCDAKKDPLGYVQKDIMLYGTKDTNSMGTEYYLYTLSSDLPDVTVNLRYFPTEEETRIEISRVESGSVTLITSYDLGFNGAVSYIFAMQSGGNTKLTSYTHGSIDPATYASGAEIVVDNHMELSGRDKPNTPYRNALNDYTETALEYLDEYLRSLGVDLSLKDLGYTSYTVNPNRNSPLRNGEETDIEMFR